MLEAWNAKKVEDFGAMPSNTQDSVMDVGADAEDISGQRQIEEARILAEMSLLKQCFEEFRPRLEKSPWAMTALLDTY